MDKNRGTKNSEMANGRLLAIEKFFRSFVRMLLCRTKI
jgi:hypothetical protein